MKRIVFLFVAIVGLLTISCVKNSVADEYSRESYIVIENYAKQSISSLSLVLDNGKRKISFVDIDKVDTSRYEFNIKRNQLQNGEKLSDFAITVVIVESDGKTFEVELTNTWAFGTDYFYELVGGGDISYLIVLPNQG